MKKSKLKIKKEATFGQQALKASEDQQGFDLYGDQEEQQGFDLYGKEQDQFFFLMMKKNWKNIGKKQ